MRFTPAILPAVSTLAGFLFWVLAAVCVPAVIIGIRRKRKWAVIFSVVTPASYLAVYLSFGNAREATNPYPLLNSPPDENVIPGTYKLSEQSRDYVRQLGYNEVDGTLVLKTDHTCWAINFPKAMIFGPPSEASPRTARSPYFDGAGTWKLSTDTGYAINLSFKRKDESGDSDPDRILATIVAPSNSQNQYALRAWVRGKSDAEVYFVKK